METVYYIHINGNQYGPLRFEELGGMGLTAETMVWRTGLPNWVRADALPELTPFINQPPYGQPGYQHPPYGQPGFQQPGYQQPSYGNPYGAQQPYGQYPYNQYGRRDLPPNWTNWMPWAIVGTVLGALTTCIGLIFGIIAITKATKANDYARLGDEANALRENNNAKTMTIISLVFAGLGIIGAVMLFTGALLE